MQRNTFLCLQTALGIDFNKLTLVVYFLDSWPKYGHKSSVPDFFIPLYKLCNNLLCVYVCAYIYRWKHKKKMLQPLWK